MAVKPENGRYARARALKQRDFRDPVERVLAFSEDPEAATIAQRAQLKNEKPRRRAVPIGTSHDKGDSL